MSDHAHPISDERLTAYLDNALGAEARADVEAALAADPALAERLYELTVPLDGLRAIMAPDVLRAPQMPEDLVAQLAPIAPQAPLQYPSAPSTSRSRLWVPSLLAASFAAGVVATYVLTPAAPAPSAPKWVEAVASYQALYVTETLAASQQDPAKTADVLAKAADDFGVSLGPALVLEGLEFKRAQMLGWNGKPLLQMAYLAADGTPMALCLTRVGAEDRGPKTSISHNLAGVSWVQDGVGYYLIGGSDADQVEALSEQVIARL